MNYKRIVSIGFNSMIYHKPGCRYVERIKNQNKMFLTKGEVTSEGYHICKYCNSMNHHIQAEQRNIDYYAKAKNMEFKYINGILYVKTEIGCWKLVYVRKEEKIAFLEDLGIKKSGLLFRDALITYMSMTNIKQQSDVEKR